MSINENEISFNSCNEETLQRINNMLSERPNYAIEQINGQRIYKHINDELIGLERGTEVFIGRLPRNCYEDELIPLFENGTNETGPIGQIRQFRLMMDFSGTNRGYAFVNYYDKQMAKSAVDKLNGHHLRRNHIIGVMPSYDKCRLFIGGIPKNKTKKDVEREMRKVTEGVKDVILYMSVYNNKNRGFCFVEYINHKRAAMARRDLGTNPVLWGKHDVRVDWADPEPEVSDEEMEKVKILHIRNLPLCVSENDLKDIFSFDDLRIERVKKIRDFAFIHYMTRNETLTAITFFNNIEFRKSQPLLKGIQVSLAKPPKPKPLRKRAISLDTTGSEHSNGGEPQQLLYPMNSMITSPQLYDQFRYYQNYNINRCVSQPMPSQQLAPIQTSTPLKCFVNHPLIDL